MRTRIATLMLLSLLALPVASQAKKVNLNWDHYYSGPQVVATLNALHNAYPELTDLTSLGKSEEGRDIWLLTINNPSTGSDTDKPGIYVDGTIHGNEIQATEVVLYTAWYLLENYESIPRVQELVDSRAFYMVPVVNVDSRWRFFEDPSYYNRGRTARVGYDDDRDGLIDEDDYEDLDGDGEILQMRIKDPFGRYRSHPDDPRIMERVESGEQGEWTILGREGIDNDGDGELNEDPVGYLDMNRNFGFKWQPPYVQGGAGDFPLSALPTRAVTKFILTKPNIVFNFAFHNYGGLWVRGPGSDLAGFYSPRDVEVYDFLGEMGEKIVPGYKYIIGGQDMYTTHGDFDEFLYSNFGIYGFVGELFTGSQITFDKDGERANAVEQQKFNDALQQGEMFRDWKPFTHPDYGEIELGGWRTFTRRIPPAFMIQEMVHRNASMVLFTAGQAPEIELELLDTTPIGNGLTRIRVRASNKNAIPSLSDKAVREKIIRKDILSIEGDSLEVLSGAIINDLHLNNTTPVEHNPDKIFVRVPSFGKVDVQWVVRGAGTARVSFDAKKAGNSFLDAKL
ncbi:hypothetical protein KQI63_06775 [bacterium]|nr:hypothetical protein [bacterium]